MDGGTKGRRRDGAHAPKSARTGKRRRSFALSVEASRRIDAEALGLGITPADLVERWALSLRRFVLVDRGGGGGPLPPPVAPPDELPAPPGRE